MGIAALLYVLSMIRPKVNIAHNLCKQYVRLEFCQCDLTSPHVQILPSRMSQFHSRQQLQNAQPPSSK